MGLHILSIKVARDTQIIQIASECNCAPHLLNTAVTFMYRYNSNIMA